MSRAALFLASALTPAAVVVLLAIAPVGCGRPPRGKFADPPPAFTPEPPSRHTLADDWDAAVRPPRPRYHGEPPVDPATRKPRQVIGDRRFYCAFSGGELAVSPDGRLLACGGNDPYTVILFDPDTGKEVGRLYGQPRAFGRGRRLVFSPDSKRLYGPGLVWDLASRRGIARFPSVNWDLTSDGNQLVEVEMVQVPWVGPPGAPFPDVFVGRHVVRVFDTRTWAEVEALAATGMGPAVAISPDGRYIALGGAGGVVRVWDRQERKELPALTALSEQPPGEPAHFRREITHLTFSPDGKTLAAASGGVGLVAGLRHVALWSWPGGALAHKLPVSDHDIASLAFTPDGKSILATGEKSLVWDVATGGVRSEGDIHKKRSYGLAAMTPDGKRFFTTGLSWRLQPVSLPDLVPIPLDPPLPNKPPEPPFAMYDHPTVRSDHFGWGLPDGSFIRAGGISRRDESFGILHTDAQRKLIRYYLRNKVVAFDVTADGKLMVTYGHDNTPGAGRELPLQFWDLATGAELAAVPLGSPKPASYRPWFSPDGKRLAFLYYRGLVKIWDVASKRPALSLDADGVAVSELGYSADGRFLVGKSGGGLAVVWDATGGE